LENSEGTRDFGNWSVTYILMSIKNAKGRMGYSSSTMTQNVVNCIIWSGGREARKLERSEVA